MRSVQMFVLFVVISAIGFANGNGDEQKTQPRVTTASMTTQCAWLYLKKHHIEDPPNRRVRCYNEGMDCKIKVNIPDEPTSPVGDYETPYEFGVSDIVSLDIQYENNGETLIWDDSDIASGTYSFLGSFEYPSGNVKWFSFNW